MSSSNIITNSVVILSEYKPRVLCNRNIKITSG
nr:MAG TPA_asm: hypothetical protein [Caudoviricetes sp.]